MGEEGKKGGTEEEEAGRRKKRKKGEGRSVVFAGKVCRPQLFKGLLNSLGIRRVRTRAALHRSLMLCSATVFLLTASFSYLC